jgi:phosphoribosylanthranilate isomerase
MSVKIKICGLRTPETLAAALDAGADYIGLVDFARSPRHLEPEAMRPLADLARGRAEIVVLTVDATPDRLAALVEAARPDLLQLHGNETLEQVAAIRARFGLPVMKVIKVATRADVDAAHAYRAAADLLLFEAKAPPAALPGGNGLSFDWSLMAGVAAGGPYMLSGGLNPGNVAAAIAATGAAMVDVSSGVESAPGVKSVELIQAFMAAARRAALPLAQGT